MSMVLLLLFYTPSSYAKEDKQKDTKKVILKTNENGDISSLLEKYHLSILKRLSKNLYLVKTTDINKTKTILYQLNHDPHVQYAHPDRIKKIIPR